MPIQRVRPKFSDIKNVSIAASTLPAGSVLQVVHRDYNPLFSTSSTSFVDITDFNVTITPSSTSSKIFLSIHSTMSTASGHSDIRLTRSIGGATATTTGFVGDQEMSSRTASTFHQYTHPSFNTTWDMPVYSITFLDSPNTTSAIVYQLQGAVPYSGTYTLYINRQSSDGDATYSARNRSSMTAMEIQG
tara:strand:- start:228 stop:794 length:567 start_codon:yes stop_codon:yes gene_type:complete